MNAEIKHRANRANGLYRRSARTNPRLQWQAVVQLAVELAHCQIYCGASKAKSLRNRIEALAALPLACLVLLAGCATQKQPPLPPGVVSTSHATAIAPPPPASQPVTLAWHGSPAPAGYYFVQGSPDLVNWQTLTNMAPLTTEYQATVPGYPLLFYRAGESLTPQ